MKDLHTLDKYRVDLRHVYGTMGDGGNGAFKVFVHGKSFNCIASNGGGWEHVSVSPGSPNRKKCPTWEEMCAIKDMFFEPEETVVQYHPPQERLRQQPSVLPPPVAAHRTGSTETARYFCGPERSLTMIKCKIARNRCIKVKTSGKIRDVMVETALLIQTIYENAHQQNPEVAAFYKNNLLGLLLNPKSPVWKEPDHG